MGVATEQKLIIKHTFLEYEGEKWSSNGTSARQRSLTEPVIFERLCYDDLRELLHSSDSSGSDEEDAGHTELGYGNVEPTIVPATPEFTFTPLHCPASRHVPFLLQEEPWMESLPAAAYWAMPPAASEHFVFPEQRENWWAGGEQFLARCAATTQTQERMAVSANAVKELRMSVMLRGFPETYTRFSVLKLLDTEGFHGRFNFLYLPVDFKQHKNLGYVIINMISAAEAMRLFAHFDGFSRWGVPSDSACSVAWCSPQQGLQAHVERYRNSPVMHESVPEEWRPMLLSHGVPIGFPSPTTKIKAPKLKRGQS